METNYQPHSHTHTLTPFACSDSLMRRGKYKVKALQCKLNSIQFIILIIMNLQKLLD